MKALVTGGGGFLGKALTQALIARGDAVRTFARGDYPELNDMGAEHVRGDIADQAAIAAAADGMDVVFHVASLVAPFGRAADFDRVNIDGTQNVIAACTKGGVDRLVFTSTPSVVHDGADAPGVDESKPYPQTFLCDYFRTKAEAERRVLAANSDALKTVALRPHGIFGPGDTSLFPLLIARAKSGRLRIIGKGETLIDWTYVDNAVDAHLLAADKLAEPSPACAGRAYFIANDEPVNPWTFFNDLLGKLDMPPVKKHISLKVAKTAGAAAEGVWRTFGLKGEPPGTRAMASVLGTTHYFDLTAAKRDLGYTPRVPLAEGVALTIPWLKAQLDAGAI